MVICSYKKNGANCWEWDGVSWEADEFSTDGNFSAYEDGEQIRLVAFADDGAQINEVIGTVESGEFTP